MHDEGVICRADYLDALIFSPLGHGRKCIVSHPVGTDHIDIEYCRQNNIQVMNCTGCNTETVAEHAMSLVSLAAIFSPLIVKANHPPIHTPHVCARHELASHRKKGPANKP